MVTPVLGYADGQQNVEIRKYFDSVPTGPTWHRLYRSCTVQSDVSSNAHQVRFTVRRALDVRLPSQPEGVQCHPQSSSGSDDFEGCKVGRRMPRHSRAFGALTIPAARWQGSGPCLTTTTAAPRLTCRVYDVCMKMRSNMQCVVLKVDDLDITFLRTTF
jgi:hypothetical protein